MHDPLMSLPAFRLLAPPLSGWGRAATALAAALLIAACATLGQPKAPEVTLEGVTAATLGPGGARARVQLAARNPNAYDLAVDALDYMLSLDGRSVGGGTLVRSVVLKAGAVTPIELSVRVDFASLGQVIDRAARSGNVPYELSGEMTLASGLRLPFQRRGDFGLTGRLVGPALPR
jgi:LEA14-like dessication related protein